MANPATFEARVSTALDETRALASNLRHIFNDLWSASNGANYEAVYNALANQGDIPQGGAITKNQMNNAISAISTLLTAYETVDAAINVVAEFSPNAANWGE